MLITNETATVEIKGKLVTLDRKCLPLLLMTANGLESWGISGRGYLYGWVNGKRVYFHKLVAEAFGMDCSQMVDHINGDKLDNRLCNLRPASGKENNRNKSKQSTPSSSRFKGVYWHRRANKWQAQIRVNGKKKSLGYFTCETEAAKAYDKAAIEYFGEFACVNFPTKATPLTTPIQLS